MYGTLPLRACVRGPVPALSSAAATVLSLSGRAPSCSARARRSGTASMANTYVGRAGRQSNVPVLHTCGKEMHTGRFQHEQAAARVPCQQQWGRWQGRRAAGGGGHEATETDTRKECSERATFRLVPLRSLRVAAARLPVEALILRGAQVLGYHGGQ